jgi:hypothetical protein
VFWVYIGSLLQEGSQPEILSHTQYRVFITLWAVTSLGTSCGTTWWADRTTTTALIRLLYLQQAEHQ